MIVAAALAFAVETCAPLEPLPDRFQVAWVSRVARTVGRHAPLVVVRTTELRRLVETEGRDATRVLRAMGMLGRRQAAGADWKVVVFDVGREQVCSPLEVGGDCPDGWHGRPGDVRARSWSGCGYLLDVERGTRTVDVLRIAWDQAVRQGFCVLPFARFLEGA